MAGPLLSKNGKYYIPAPFSWFYPKSDDKDINNAEVMNVEKIYKSQNTSSSLIRIPAELQWIKSEHSEIISAGGMWVDADELRGTHRNIELLSPSAFFVSEERTGIALSGRSVREGHLYTMNHIRLKENVEIVFAVDSELPLDDSGVLKLGGEQRFGRYNTIDSVLEFSDSGNRFLSLSPIKAQGNSEYMLATGKIQYIGGWDMNKGFHKDMVGYYPAGSVFNKKIDANCIGIAEAD